MKNLKKNGVKMSDLIHEAALKAMEATNLCTKHMQYHGQKTPQCTPQKRVMIEVKS